MHQITNLPPHPDIHLLIQLIRLPDELIAHFDEVVNPLVNVVELLQLATPAVHGGDFVLASLPDVAHQRRLGVGCAIFHQVVEVLHLQDDGSISCQVSGINRVFCFWPFQNDQDPLYKMISISDDDDDGDGDDVGEEGDDDDLIRMMMTMMMMMVMTMMMMMNNIIVVPNPYRTLFVSIIW